MKLQELRAGLALAMALGIGLAKATLAVAEPATAVAPANEAPAQVGPDPRIVTALDEAIARYRRDPSFSITATNELRGGASTAYSRIAASLQFPLRGRLQVDRTDAKGQVQVPLTRRLISAKSYQLWDLLSSEYKPNESQYRPLDTDKDRVAAWSHIFQASPDLGFSIFSFVAGTNPAKTKFVIRSGMDTEKHDGQEYQRIFLRRSEPSDPNPILLEYLISTTSHELREFVLRRRVGDKDFVAMTRFAPPEPNWKGSQEATDGAVYDWKTIAIPDVAAPGPKPAPKISIEPSATRIFGRAAALYGGLSALQMGWREEMTAPNAAGGKQTATVQIAWDRRGRLRLENSLGLDQLVVVGPRAQSSLDASGLGYGEKAKYKTQPIKDDGQAALLAGEALEWGGGHISTLGKLLGGTNILAPDEVTSTVTAEELFEMSAVALPSEPLDGQPCDLVRVIKRYDDRGTVARGDTAKRLIYWFAQKDGRLLRVQTYAKEGTQKPYSADMNVTSQEFKPVFGNETFVFTAPKDAVLSKD